MLPRSFNSRTPGGVRLDTSDESTRARSVSIHAPREGCDGVHGGWLRGGHVSIHAPREGCDSFGKSYLARLAQFQFTHPGRGATHPEGQSKEELGVSIHAPREGCDIIGELSVHTCNGFNSRTPGGVRLPHLKPPDASRRFQFTHPGRGATQPSPPRSSG